MSFRPGATGSGVSLLLIVMAGGAVVVVTDVLTTAEVLFSSLPSAMVLSGSTTAVLVSDPAAAGATTCRRMLPFWPAFTRPPMHVTVIGAPAEVQVNRLVVSKGVACSVTPAGRVSLTLMSLASAVPMLFTVRT